AMAAVANLPILAHVRVTYRPDFAERDIRLASTQANAALPVVMDGTLPQSPALPPAPAPIPDPAVVQQSDAADRLREKVPNALYPYFDVYLYVSKAASGSLVFEQSFPVSTARELHERYFTDTPDGLFELDPDRFETMHYSHTWHGAAMPWAMFLNATIHGRQTGVALHSSGEAHAALLGRRASGGCVRLPPQKAHELFERFRAEERG